MPKAAKSLSFLLYCLLCLTTKTALKDVPGWSPPASRPWPSAQSPSPVSSTLPAAFASALSAICTPKEIVAAEQLLLTQADGNNELKGKGCIASLVWGH